MFYAKWSNTKYISLIDNLQLNVVQTYDEKMCCNFTYIVIGMGIKKDGKVHCAVEYTRTVESHKKVNEYDQELPQSHTADQPAAS